MLRTGDPYKTSAVTRTEEDFSGLLLRSSAHFLTDPGDAPTLSRRVPAEDSPPFFFTAHNLCRVGATPAMAGTAYDDGPVNGTTDAWAFSGGFAFTNSFRCCREEHRTLFGWVR